MHTADNSPPPQGLPHSSSAGSRVLQRAHKPGLCLQAVCLTLLLLLLLGSSRSFAERQALHLLHGADAVHDLPPARGVDAHASLQSIVTYYDPSEHLLFVQDQTGGVFVNAAHNYPVAAGDLVSIQGSIKYGYRAGIADDAVIRVLGRGPAIQPISAAYRSLVTGGLDCRLVRVSGVVKDAVVEHHPESQSDPLHLDVALEGGAAEVYVYSHPGTDPLSLLGKRVLVTGVAGGAFNAKQQMTGTVLYSQDMSGLTVEGQQEQSWSALPLTSPDAIFSAVRVKDASPRIHLRGSVAYFAPGESAYLEQDGEGVFVQTRQTGGVSVGDVVDVYGFPNSRSYVPSLREAVLNGTREHRQVAPRPVTYEQALSGSYADRLISIEGKVLSQWRSAELSSLTLEVQGHVVRGSIENGAAVPGFALGSRVRMTGICQIATGGPWREPVRFSVLARSASDLALVRGPSWWSTRHLAELLGILLGLSLLVTSWAAWLHRRVARQACRIQRSMLIADKRSALLKQISLNLPLEEMLASVCRTLSELLPGAQCEFDLRAPVPAGRGGDLIRVFACGLLQDESDVGEFAIFTAQQPQPQQREVLAMARELLMLALNNAMLHQKLMHRSTHDCLTDLPNRRLCEQRLDLLLSDAGRYSRSFSVLYVDVNQFKAVNDRHGHKLGDCYLQAIGKRLRGELRPECTVARIGGDEFLILLPDCDEPAALQILVRLECCFAQPFILGSVWLDGSASFGLANFPVHGKTREELEQHADAAKFAAKSELGSYTDLQHSRK